MSWPSSVRRPSLSSVSGALNDPGPRLIYRQDFAISLLRVDRISEGLYGELGCLC